nr:unnamed protein product [Spirometra erinaceieuropaei]
MWVCQSLSHPQPAVKHNVIFKLRNSSCSCDQSLFSSASKLLKAIFESHSPDKNLGSSLGIKIKDSISPDEIVVSLEESPEAFGAIHQFLHNPDFEIDVALLPSACQLAKKLEFSGAWCIFARRLLASITLDNIGEICPLVLFDPKNAVKGINTERSALENSLSDAALRFIRENADSIACSQTGQLSACLYVDVIIPAPASQPTTPPVNSDEDAFVPSDPGDLSADQLTDWQLTDCVLHAFVDQENSRDTVKESGYKPASKTQAAAKDTVTDEIRLTLTEAQLLKSKGQRLSQYSLSSCASNGNEAAESAPSPQIPVTPDTETCLLAKTSLGVGSISIHLGKLEGRLVSLSVKRVLEQQQQQQQSRRQPSTPSTATVSSFSRTSSISEASSRHHQGTSVILPPSPVLSRNGNVTEAPTSPLEAISQPSGPDEQMTIVADDGRAANLVRLCSEGSSSSSYAVSSPLRRSRCSVLRSVGCLRNRLSLARSAAGACSVSSPAVTPPLLLPRLAREEEAEEEDAADSDVQQQQQQQCYGNSTILLAGGYTQNGCLDSVELLNFSCVPSGGSKDVRGLSVGMPVVDGQQTPPYLSDSASTPDSGDGPELDFCSLPGPRMHCARGRLALTTTAGLFGEGDCVFACGGSDGSKDLNSVECISTTALARWMQHQASAADATSVSQESIGEDGGVVGGSRDEWRLLASLQQARSCAAAAVIEGARVVVLGGQVSGQPLSSVEVYEVERNEWFYLPQMLEARTQLCSASVPSRNLVLAVGGISNAAGGTFVAPPQPTFESDFHGLSVSAEALDCRCSRWFRLPEPISRGSLIGSTLVPLPSSSGRVMLIGGSDGHAALTQTQIFDLRAWTWLSGPSLAVGRFSPSAVLLSSSFSGPSIAVIGGYNVAAGGFLNSVEVVSMSDCTSPACISPWASVSLCPPAELPPPQELLPDVAAADNVHRLSLYTLLRGATLILTR